MTRRRYKVVDIAEGQAIPGNGNFAPFGRGPKHRPDTEQYAHELNNGIRQHQSLTWYNRKNLRNWVGWAIIEDPEPEINEYGEVAP